MAFSLKKLSKIVGLGRKHKAKEAEAKPDHSLSLGIVHESQSSMIVHKKNQASNKDGSVTLQGHHSSTIEAAQLPSVNQVPENVSASSTLKEEATSDTLSIHYSSSHSSTSCPSHHEESHERKDDAGVLKNASNVKSAATECSDDISISLDFDNEDESIVHDSKHSSGPGVSRESSIPMEKQRSGSSKSREGIANGTASECVGSHADGHASKRSSAFAESRSISLDRDQPLVNASEDASGSREKQKNKFGTTSTLRRSKVSRKHAAAKEVHYSSSIEKIVPEEAGVEPSALRVVSPHVAVTLNKVSAKKLGTSNSRTSSSLNPKVHVSQTTQRSSQEKEREHAHSAFSDRHCVIPSRASSCSIESHSSHYLLQSRKRDASLYGNDAPGGVVKRCANAIAPDVLKIISKCTQDAKSSQQRNRSVPLHASACQRNEYLSNPRPRVRHDVNSTRDTSPTQSSLDYTNPKRYSKQREMHHQRHIHTNLVDIEGEPLWNSNSSTLSLSSRGVKTPLRGALHRERVSSSRCSSEERLYEGYGSRASRVQHDSYRSVSSSNRRVSPTPPRRYASDAHPDLRSHLRPRLTGHRALKHGLGLDTTQDESEIGRSFSLSASLNSPPRRRGSDLRSTRRSGSSPRRGKPTPTRVAGGRSVSSVAASTTPLPVRRGPFTSEERQLLDRVQRKLNLLANEVADHDAEIEQDMRSSPWRRLYHLGNPQDQKKRRALVAQFDKLAKIREKIETGAFSAEIEAREERLRKQKELLSDPNGVYLRLYNARPSARAAESGLDVSRGSCNVSASGSSRSRLQKKPNGSGVLQSRSNGSTRASPSVSGRSGDEGREVVRRTEAQRAEFFANMYTRAMNEVHCREKKIREALKKREQHDLEELVVARLAARVERDLRRRCARGADPLAVAQSKWKKQASKDDNTVQAFMNQLIHGPKLSSDDQEKMAHRLTVQGYIKPETLKKRREELEVKGCTFHPCIGNYSSLNRSAREGAISPRADNRKTNDNGFDGTDTSEVKGGRLGQQGAKGIAENRCNKLYRKAVQERDREKEKRKEHERQQRLDILKSRLSSDHHFRKRVELNPSLAEHFMNSLSV